MVMPSKTRFLTHLCLTIQHSRLPPNPAYGEQARSKPQSELTAISPAEEFHMAAPQNTNLRIL